MPDSPRPAPSAAPPVDAAPSVDAAPPVDAAPSVDAAPPVDAAPSVPGPPDSTPSAPRVTRRMVLVSAGLAAAAATATGARVASWWRQDPSAPLACLSADEAALVDAIAEAAFPPGGTPALSGADAGIPQYLDALFAQMPEPTPSLLRALLHAIDDWARLTRRAGFARLPLAARQDALAAWVRHDNHLVRGAIGGFMTFLSTAYCGHPDVRTACGWVFPCGYER